jgi:hypothetical protein
MSTAKIPSYVITNSGRITVVTYGKTGGCVYTADVTHVNYSKIKDALKSKSWKKLASLFDVGKTITKRGRGKLEVKHGQILFNNEPLHHVVVDRIMVFMSEGLDFKPLFNFLKNLLQNPSPNSVKMEYEFIEANELPITWDGYFLAYKKVDDDFKDFHTHSLDNSPGKTVEMNRSDVCEDPNEPCHRGLHVGGLGYARDSYKRGLGKLLVVKVHPADVVSVPNDYSHGKCRTCKYTVLAELEDPTRMLKQADASQYVPDDDLEETCHDCGNLLDDCCCDECPDCGEHPDDCTCG